MAQKNCRRFRAIIVGGSVAGLTLAHTFDSAGIDYVLLEGRDHIAPAAGATIVLFPNGTRVLDQLGLYEQLQELVEPMLSSMTWRSDGRFVSENEWPKLVGERFGYPCGIYERQRFLQSLYDQLKRKDKVLVNKRVVEIKHGLNSVSVLCADGSEFIGDIVVGADGIHSRVRQEMQRLSEEETPGRMAIDKDCITAEYNCIFGTSSPDATLPPGQIHLSIDIDHSSLLFTGKDSLHQWFFVSKLDKKYKGSSIPRFTQKQLEEQIQQHEDYNFAENVPFKNLLKTTRTMSYLPLEEANHEYWTWKRIVCAGDSIHKMTPNAGQGGNQAIESAAVLTNCLLELLDQSKDQHPPLSKLDPILQKYQDIRKDRSKIFVNFSGLQTRSDALANLTFTLRFLYLKPLTAKTIANIQTMWYSTAPRLNHLPIPKCQEGNTIWEEDDDVAPKTKVIRAQL